MENFGIKGVSVDISQTLSVSGTVHSLYNTERTYEYAYTTQDILDNLKPYLLNIPVNIDYTPLIINKSTNQLCYIPQISESTSVSARWIDKNEIQNSANRQYVYTSMAYVDDSISTIIEDYISDKYLFLCRDSALQSSNSINSMLSFTIILIPTDPNIIRIESSTQLLINYNSNTQKMNVYSMPSRYEVYSYESPNTSISITGCIIIDYNEGGTSTSFMRFVLPSTYIDLSTT